MIPITKAQIEAGAEALWNEVDGRDTWYVLDDVARSSSIFLRYSQVVLEAANQVWWEGVARNCGSTEDEGVNNAA